MVRRWLIRGLALSLLTLCVVAWVGSYWEMVGVEVTETTRSQFFYIESGLIVIGDGEQSLWIGGKWMWSHQPAQSLHRRYQRMKYHFAGFAYHPSIIPKSYLGVTAAPLWLPTLLSAGLVYLVWRKTRPKHNGKGFPVEPAGKEATQP